MNGNNGAKNHDNLKILTIGNSFTDSLALYFPTWSASVPAELHLRRPIMALRVASALEPHRNEEHDHV